MVVRGVEWEEEEGEEEEEEDEEEVCAGRRRCCGSSRREVRRCAVVVVVVVVVVFLFVVGWQGVRVGLRFVDARGERDWMDWRCLCVALFARLRGVVCPAGRSVRGSLGSVGFCWRGVSACRREWMCVGCSACRVLQLCVVGWFVCVVLLACGWLDG